MGEMETDPDLAEILPEFVHERGPESMEAICFGQTSRFSALACSQDAIGWQRLLEGMVLLEIATLQQQHLQVSGSRMSIDRWMTGLIIKLLEITHGQWLYRNVIVHDNTTGTLITKRKEEIKLEIERQQELVSEGLLEKYKCLAEVRLEELESTNGDRKEYWLLAIKSARKVKEI